MSTALITLAIILAALGAGLMAGVYFAFSGFIMRALDQLGSAQAADAMNSINEVILGSWFMHVFFGSTVIYAGLSVYAIFDPALPGRWVLFGTGVLYVAGMFLCTAIFNVPINNRLAASANDEKAKVQIWEHYIEKWTRWNHVRSVCSLATLIMSIFYQASYIQVRWIG